jgi:hypothetical protein
MEARRFDRKSDPSRAEYPVPKESSSTHPAKRGARECEAQALYGALGFVDIPRFMELTF